MLEPQSIAVTVVNVGFAVWLGWYYTTRVIPKLQRDHKEEREGYHAVAVKERTETRQEFLSEIRNINTVFANEMQQQRVQCLEEAGRIDKRWTDHHASVERLLIQLRQERKERHEGEGGNKPV